MDWRCKDCKCNTWTEYYMVHDHVWRVAAFKTPTILLCISCLENRLDRELTAADFTDCPLNIQDEDVNWGRSPLLQRRLNTQSISSGTI